MFFLRIGKRRIGLQPGFILSISADDRLFAWDMQGTPIQFVDCERSREPLPALPLHHYIGSSGHGGLSLLNLLAGMAGYHVEFTSFSETKIRCRCDVPGNLYVVVDPGKPATHVYTPRQSLSTRPVAR